MGWLSNYKRVFPTRKETREFASPIEGLHADTKDREQNLHGSILLLQLSTSSTKKVLGTVCSHACNAVKLDLACFTVEVHLSTLKQQPMQIQGLLLQIFKARRSHIGPELYSFVLSEQ